MQFRRQYSKDSSFLDRISYCRSQGNSIEPGIVVAYIHNDHKVL